MKEDIMKECRQIEKAFNDFNYYCTDIQNADLLGETRTHLQKLLQAELHNKVSCAVIDIEYTAQRQADRIEKYRDRAEEYKEQSDRQDRQIRHLQNELQAERAEHRSTEEWDKLQADLQADLQAEKRKRIEAEWKLAVYMIKH